MHDYQTLLSQAQSELTQLQQQEAIYKSKIAELCSELGLVNDDTLIDKAKSLRSQLEQEISDTNTQIDEILSQLQ